MRARFAVLAMSRSEALRVLKLEDNPLILTKEEAVEAFRRAAKRTHPDVAGGSKSAFQQCQEAISVLSQELPTQDDLIKARAAHIDVMEEQRFSKRRGMGSLIAAPRGIFQKLKLNLKADLSDRIASSRDYVFEKAKSSDRPVEATGRNVMTPEQIQLEQEMDELKREDLRTKGVGRMVDSLIAEAIREGKFSSPSGKGQPLNEDYYEAHLSLANPLERKVMEKLKEGGFVPEWVEIRKDLEDQTCLLRRLVRKEIELVERKWEYGELLLNGKDIPETIGELERLTKRFNLLCPPPLQRTSSKPWLNALIESEIQAWEDDVKKSEKPGKSDLGPKSD